MSEHFTSALTTVRRLTANNVHETVPLLTSDLAVPPMCQAEAIDACRALLVEGSMTGVVVESAGSKGRPRVVGVGGAVFVSKQFVDNERAHPQPGLAERVLTSASKGRSVALAPRKLAATNLSTGLHVAVVLHNWVGEASEPLLRDIRHHLAASFVSNLRGYHLVEIIGEVSGHADLTWALSGGFRVRSDYADWYKDRVDPHPRRYLIGLTRDEALSTQGSVLSLMFHYARPRFAFTSAQRRLLDEAMQHKTDAEIASALCISVSAVKKGWAAIFDRAGDVLASIPLQSTPLSAAQSVRGIQKRHRLLTYLLDHPEELRP